MTEEKRWKTLKSLEYLTSFLVWHRQDTFKPKGFAGGAFIAQVAENLIMRHTEKWDWVWDPMAGTGTTGTVAEKLGRYVLMTDLNPIKPCIRRADAAEVFVEATLGCAYSHVPILHPLWQEGLERVERMLFDLIIWHPPYHNVIVYSDNPKDLSAQETTDEFFIKFSKAAYNIVKHLKPGGFIGLVMGDVWEDGEVCPLGFISAEILKSVLPEGSKLKAIAVKNIEGNRAGDSGYHLRLSRLARWGALDFKHEYIFSIQKAR